MVWSGLACWTLRRTHLAEEAANGIMEANVARGLAEPGMTGARQAAAPAVLWLGCVCNTGGGWVPLWAHTAGAH